MKLKFGDKIKIVGLPFYEGIIGYIVNRGDPSSTAHDVLLEFNVVRNFYAENLALIPIRKVKNKKPKRGSK